VEGSRGAGCPPPKLVSSSTLAEEIVPSQLAPNGLCQLAIVPLKPTVERPPERASLPVSVVENVDPRTVTWAAVPNEAVTAPLVWRTESVGPPVGCPQVGSPDGGAGSFASSARPVSEPAKAPAPSAPESVASLPWG